MGRAIKDISGKTYKKIKVISFSHSDKINTYWNCECLACGKKIVLSKNKIYKNIACGCLKGKTTFKYKNHNNPKLYKKWNHMMSRCYNANDISYKNYGGRGIEVCEEWKNYDTFYEWSINNGYKEDLEIDRIDVNFNYCPSNCRYVSRLVNANNKQNTKYYIYKNKITCLSDIAKDLGIDRKLLWQKITRDNQAEKYDIEIKEI